MLDVVAYLQINIGLFIFSQNDTEHYVHCYPNMDKMFMKMHDGRKESMFLHFTNVQKKSQPLKGKLNAHLCSSEMVQCFVYSAV